MDDRANEKLITSFLLGELSESDRASVEERFFVDDHFYTQLLALQEELASDYVQGRLSSEQRQHFEQHFMQSARRRQRVDFAAVLHRAVTEGAGETVESEPGRGSAWWSFLTRLRPQRDRFALALASILLLAAASWLALVNRRLQARLDAARVDRESVERYEANERKAEREKRDLEAEIARLRASAD